LRGVFVSAPVILNPKVNTTASLELHPGRNMNCLIKSQADGVIVKVRVHIHMLYIKYGQYELGQIYIS